MISRLFSIFDPQATINLNLNWIRIVLISTLLFSKFWLINNKVNTIILTLMKLITIEFNTILKTKKNKPNLILIIRFIILLLLRNFIRLYPYIFNSTSHIVVTLGISLPLWIGLILFGWINIYNNIFSHLVPEATPPALIPLIVIIESIRNLIRPITLSIRLGANIIAGHLLVCLLGNQFTGSSVSTLIILFLVQISLIILESAVSLIQAYVFSTLITLYIREI